MQHFLNEEGNFLQVVKESNRRARQSHLAHLCHVGRDVVRRADQREGARIGTVIALAGGAHEAVDPRTADFVARRVLHHRPALATVVGLALGIRHLLGEVVIEFIGLAPRPAAHHVRHGVDVHATIVACDVVGDIREQRTKTV